MVGAASDEERQRVRDLIAKRVLQVLRGSEPDVPRVQHLMLSFDIADAILDMDEMTGLVRPSVARSTGVFAATRRRRDDKPTLPMPAVDGRGGDDPEPTE
jgi:hypothetical protein